ncbi:DUF5342 family protein [Bacillus sp. FJAT-45350]|uniref:DUF5342 family protein n=1 Tax=Bacillus sp. FJAT-45350 TaxID=2011014 RepID=UPI000BB7AFC3|nr:DUF5342 family protein [Bacillus sp. FJAT-45350]
MISHFNWKERDATLIKKEIQFSFFFKGEYYQGMYYSDGTITWTERQPDGQAKENLEMQIHDLILYHVYEDH